MVVSAGLLLIVAFAGVAATPLQGSRGTQRVLIVSAPSGGDPAFRTQDRWLAREGAGLQERDLVVIRIVGNTVETPQASGLDAKAVRQAAGLEPATFGVALVGKDGSVVFQKSQPVAARTLFALIDAMPMRRREMELRKP